MSAIGNTLSEERNKMATPTRFWDRVADRYSRSPIADEDAYRKKLEVTRRYFTPDSEVLELGCGTGGTALLHAPHVKHYRATDISRRMIEIAEGKKGESTVENLSFEQASLESIDVADGSVDAVLALSLLHLLEDKDTALRKVHGMLKTGGVLVSSTVCLGDHMRWFRFVGPIGRFLRLMPLVRVFTQRELIESIEAAGFEIDYEWRPGKGKAAFIVARKA